MKKVILLVAFTFAMAATVLAQTEATPSQAEGKGKGKGKHEKHEKGRKEGKGSKLSPDEKADKVAQHLEKSLGLSADQKQKVRDLAKTRAEKIAAAKSLKGEERKTQRQAAQQEFKAALDQVLTADQKQKWETIKAEKKAQREAAGKGKGKGKGRGKGKEKKEGAQDDETGEDMD